MKGTISYTNLTNALEYEISEEFDSQKKFQAKLFEIMSNWRFQISAFKLTNGDKALIDQERTDQDLGHILEALPG